MPASHTVDITHLQRLATRLFVDGQYKDADRVLAELADISEAERAQIALRRAQIGMLSDCMDDVEKQLDIARDEFGAYVYYVGMQADMAVRRGDLSSAAHALHLLGRHARAAQLEGFEDGWYKPVKVADTAVEWDDRFALPLFEATINGHTGHFVLDTGTGDCLLDSVFAQRAQVTLGQYDQASFAGGHVGQWQLARIDTLSIGDSRFEQLPAQVAPLGDAFSHGYEGTTVDGIIGAGLLRCAGGIDIEYPDTRFTLGRPAGVDEDDSEPLWIAGPHYPLTPCRVNDGPTSSWFIDSGMSGIDLALSESAARRYGAQQLGNDIEAEGGGGTVNAKAVEVSRFQHADLITPRLHAAVLQDFKLGRELGIRIGGIIGHNWLRGHRLRIDYPAMRVYIDRH